MRSTTPAHTFALAFAFLSTVSHALVVTLPTATTDWDVTGASPNYIQWALYPLTFPPPASQFFDIYIRNGVGGMYQPFLNQTLALSVDASTTLMFEVPATEVVKFVRGTGYQLFLSNPADASTVYCQSEVFSIGTMPSPSDPALSSGIPTAPALPSTTTDMFATLSSNIASESSSMVVVTNAPSSVSAAPSLSSPVASPSAASTAGQPSHNDDEEIEEASSPGGLWQQGGSLLFGSANQLSSGKTTMAAAVVAAGLLWLA